MAQLKALREDGTAPSVLLAQIEGVAQDAAAAAAEGLATPAEVAAAVADRPTASVVEEAISAATTGLASEGYVDAAVAAGGGGAVGIPIFVTLAEAQAWEAEHPGRTALTIEEPADPDPGPIEVTASAPTFDDAARTWVIPTVTGVRYLYAGVVVTGTHEVGDAAVTVTITAEAEDGYTLVGTASWSHSWDAAEEPAEGDAAAAPGTVLTADDFSGDGPILGRTSTPGILGGQARIWQAGAHVSQQGATSATADGALAAGAAANIAILPVARADVEASFTIVSMPTGPGDVVSLRDGAGRRIVVNFSSAIALRVQRFGPSGGTIISGMQATMGPATAGTRMIFRAVGGEVFLTCTVDTGSEVTLAGTDADWLNPGDGIGIALPPGMVIDDLVVTAR